MLSAILLILSVMYSSFSCLCLSSIGHLVGGFSLHIQRIAASCIVCSLFIWDLLHALIGISGYMRMGSMSALYSLSFNPFLSSLNLFNFLSSFLALPVIMCMCLLKKLLDVILSPKIFLVC